MNRIMAIALGVTIPIFAYEPMAWLLRNWIGNSWYRHGWGVAVVAGLLCVFQMCQSPRQVVAPCTWAWWFAGSALCYVVGLAAGMISLRAAAVFMVLVCLAYCFSDRLPARALRFPLLFPVLAIPLPFIAELTAFLQFATVRWAVFFLKAIGYDIVAEGVVIRLPHATFMVGAPSSGIQSLIVLVTLMVLMVFLTRVSTAKTILLCAMSVPLAMIGNGCRVTALLVAGNSYGAQAAYRFWHHTGNTLFFLFSLTLLGALWYFVAGRLRTHDRPAP